MTGEAAYHSSSSWDEYGNVVHRMGCGACPYWTRWDTDDEAVNRRFIAHTRRLHPGWTLSLECAQCGAITEWDLGRDLGPVAMDHEPECRGYREAKP